MVAFTDQDFFAMYKMEPEQLKNYLLHLAPCIRERSFVTNEIRPGMRQLIPKDNSHVRVEKQRFDGAKLIAPSLIGGEDR